MIIDPDDTNITPPLQNDHIWEKKSTEAISKMLKKGDVFVDCGAHWGYYSLLASSIVGPEGLVYAFEPSPSNFSLLSMNIAINNIGNVRVLPLALLDSYAVIPFVPEDYRHTTGGSHLNLRPEDMRVKAYYFITQTSMLDGMFKPNDIDFIKIDCEGSDRNILVGAMEILTNGHAKIMIENPPKGVLESWGYKEILRFPDEQTWFFEKK